MWPELQDSLAARPSQEFHLPREAGSWPGHEVPSWTRDRRPLSLSHTLLPSSSAVTQSLGLFPFLQHPSVLPPSRPAENTQGPHCCSPLSDLRSLLVGRGDLIAVP